MHGKWCRRFIDIGFDIRSRGDISEVVMEEGMGGGVIITRRWNHVLTYQLVIAVFLGETGKVVDAKMRAKELDGIGRAEEDTEAVTHPFHQLLLEEVSILRSLGRDMRYLEDNLLDGLQWPMISDNCGEDLRGDLVYKGCGRVSRGIKGEETVGYWHNRRNY